MSRPAHPEPAANAVAPPAACVARASAPHRIAIRPVWTIAGAQGHALPPRVLELLVQVQAQGSLRAACLGQGLSYRHAWDLIRQGEALLGAPLLHMERGKGSRLSPLAHALVWADHRIHARLKPVLDTLASELAVELQRLLPQMPEVPHPAQLPHLALHPAPAQPLRIQASHGFAVEALVQALLHQGLAVEHRYGSSVEAAAALHDGSCELAGFHIPAGPLQAAALAHYARWLAAPDLVVIDIAIRRQGLILAPGNPCKVYELADLARPGLRFINRQAGSGTRFLLEGLLQRAGLAPERIPGFERGEFTHAAVAAFVASGMADVGFGLETPARHFKLDFIPLASERYFLLCRQPTLNRPALHAVLATLRSPEFQAEVNALPGYHAGHCGQVLPFAAAFGPMQAETQGDALGPG
jgi:molybdate transport repressor ModE-like protein